MHHTPKVYDVEVSHHQVQIKHLLEFLSTPQAPKSQISFASNGFCASRRRPDESNIEDGLAHNS